MERIPSPTCKLAGDLVTRLYFCWYNWIRKHKTLGTTPAIAAGLSDKALTMIDVAELIDERHESLIQERRASLLAQLPQSN
jgi:hypothetical protein